MSPAHLCLVLHAHLPFVRHPEHERFLEEIWFFEAVIESYLPLVNVLDGWNRDRIPARLTFTITPTLCSMLRDPLLQIRCGRHLDRLIELAEREIHRNTFLKDFQAVAMFYHERLTVLRGIWTRCEGDLLGRFKEARERGQIEIITSAATHALLPLLSAHPPAVRGQLLTARDHYRECFGIDPEGIWLPECAWSERLEPLLLEAGLKWFITDTQGVVKARPEPQFGHFAPVATQGGLLAFGRDPETARQVWSREEGYPGDFRYRDFYRDIGFDLDLEYLEPYLGAPGVRGFTGMKYHRITGAGGVKEPYHRGLAMVAVREHAHHFLAARLGRTRELRDVLPQAPLFLCPYDAELFGHWWYEGPEFIDSLARQAQGYADEIVLGSPADFISGRGKAQVGMPADSSWGEDGYWKVWLNEKNHWIHPSTREAGMRMSGLVRKHGQAVGVPARVLKQAARELLLAQSSDWPFILRMGTSPDYARRRVIEHLEHFDRLWQMLETGNVDEAWLGQLESRDNLFPSIRPAYWETSHAGRD